MGMPRLDGALLDSSGGQFAMDWKKKAVILNKMVSTAAEPFVNDPSPSAFTAMVVKSLKE